jgi:hypothetical protein
MYHDVGNGQRERRIKLSRSRSPSLTLAARRFRAVSEHVKVRSQGRHGIDGDTKEQHLTERENLLDWANRKARQLLRKEPVQRHLHTQAVASKAAIIGGCMASDGDVLIAAAYLHDIGYSSQLRRSGFHPLDGAIYLRDLGHEHLARLVAHHSYSVFAADLLGLSAEIRPFQYESSFLMDALTYCDMTTDSHGRSVVLDKRLARAYGSYGADHVVARALKQAEPSLRRTVNRVEGWIVSQSNLVCGSRLR